MNRIASLLAATTLVAATTALAAAPAAKPMYGSWGFDLTAMDTSAKPGDDFFLYANGTWLRNAKIPADRTGTGSFQDLTVLSETRMKEIASDLDSQPYDKLDAEGKQLRDFYDTYTDEAAIEAAGLKPVQKDLDRIAKLKTLDDVAKVMGDPSLEADSLFATRVIADPKDSNAYVMTITQAGLGLPDRDYYLREDPNLATTREAYKKYLATMLGFAGVKNPEARAAAVYDLETAIAKIHWVIADRRDADKTYNPMTFTALNYYAPGFPWGKYFAAEGLGETKGGADRVVIVRENTAFPGLAKLYAATPVAVWRDWLTAHYLHNMSEYLPKAIDTADFEFYGKVLSNQVQEIDRKTRGVRVLDRRLGHPLGKIYTARYFPPESKAKVEQLIANLLKAYDADIRTLPWMTEVTRQKALDKLHAFRPHVGYPDKWRDYTGLRIVKGDLVGNIQRSDLFEWRYRLDRIDQPTDRSEWNMTPPTINAYYTQTYNSIFFPAAILQPPFFDPNADDAVNYGGIGAVIGHEISHGFDDQGSKYDGAGLLQSWWTPDDRKAFEARTTMLGAQYDSYEGLPGIHVNGKLTMGENIGDLSGITIALKAYHLSLGDKKAPVLDGFTGDQRFFLAFAQIWRAKDSDGYTRQRLLSNPHSPPHFRADGATRNVDDWYTAFNVKPGDKMYVAPDQRVKLW
jgi:putative endopeptidase